MKDVKKGTAPRAGCFGIGFMKRALVRVLSLPAAVLPLSVLCGLLLTAAAQAATLCSVTYAESGVSNDTQYAFSETAQLTGSGFAPLCDVSVRISRPDGQVELGTVTTDATGGFAFSYQLATLAGDYVVSFLGEGGAELTAISFSNGPVVMLDKGDVRDGDAVRISGTAFPPLSTVIVRVIRPDNSVVKSDGTAGSDSVTVDSIGDFAYDYVVRDGVLADYLVDVLDSQANILATTSFTDSAAFVKNIGTDSSNGTGTSLSITLPSGVSVTAGNSIIIGVAWANTASPVTCTDSASNAYATDVTATGPTGSVSILSAHNVNMLGTGGAVTCTIPGPSSGARTMSANEFSGLVTTLTLDRTHANSGNTNTPTSGATVATSQSDELLFGAAFFAGSSGNFTAGNNPANSCPSYTLTGPVVSAGQTARLATEYAIATASGTYAACGTRNQASQWAAAIATYKISTVKDTTTTITSSSNPSAFGDSVMFTARVTTGATPVTTGSVTFIEGGTCASPGTTLAGPTALNGSGEATFSTATLAYGSHTVVACYGGTAGFNSSNGSVAQAISTRSITVTADAQSKIYGDADPNPLTYKITSGSLASGDSFSGALTRAPGENAGTYAILQGTLALNSNYSVTYVGADFTIKQKDATWTTNPASKTYGDPDLSPLTTGSGSGFLAVDGVSATYSRVPGETVAGGPYHITATLSATAASALSNYNITNVGAEFTIKKKDATWTTNAASKTYGDADPSPLTTGSGSAFLAGDGVTATYSRVSGENASPPTYHVTATLSATVAGALNNYNITNAGAEFTIKKKDATWTTNAAGKTYGDPDPSPLTTGSGSGFLASDGITAIYTRVAGETASPPAYHITATLSATVAGALSNYNITNTGAEFTINKRNATWTTNSNNKTYGYADPAPLTTGSGSGFLPGDGVTATYSRVSGENASPPTYHVTATLSATVAGALNNYNITNAGAEFTINKRNATWTTNAASKSYGDADPSPVTTGSGSGFLPGDGISATYSRVAGETASPPTYHITATLSATAAGALSNYNITNAGAEFTINKRNATWTTNPASKTYGDADPASLTTGSGSGFLLGDGVTATYSRTAGENASPPSYHITATLSARAGALNNYNITNAGAEFTINRRNATWTTNPASKTYGYGDPVPLTSGYGYGFLSSDGVTATYSRLPGETVVGGPYLITATLSATGALGNYNIANAGAYFTINQANASVLTYTRSKFVNDPDPVPLTTGNLNGFLAADQVTASYSRMPNQEAVGAYPIVVTLSPAAVLSNYSITSNAPRLIIADISGSTDPIAKGALVSLTVTLPSGPDVPACSIAWGDGAVTDCGAQHAYGSAGVYAPVVTLTDGDNASTSRAFKYVVVYDASAGFVTGGGWIVSPVGAYAANPSLTGKANFGFVSKYQKGANVPTGETEFQFQTGNFNFKSTEYDWLVISGSKAQYKGSGTINGAGDYGFMLTGIDGSANRGADKLRLKVWDKTTNATIYDNQIGAADTADPSTALGGGSIVVHK